MSDYGEQAETAFRYFAIEGGSDDPGAQHDDGSDWFKPDPTPEPLTAEEIANRAQQCRFCGERAVITHGVLCPDPSFLATLDATRDRPGLDVERLAQQVVATLTDADALAILARRGRVIAIVVPRGIETEDIQQITREVNERLDALVAERGLMS